MSMRHDEYSMLQTLMFARGLPIIEQEIDMEYIKAEIIRRQTKGEGTE